MACELECRGSSRRQHGGIVTSVEAWTAIGSLRGVSTDTEQPVLARAGCRNGEQDIMR
jgi:hypothetical protein